MGKDINESEDKVYEFCYKSTAIKILGISGKKFDELGLEPAKLVPNPYYRSGSLSSLYKREEIELLAVNPDIVAMRPKPKKPKDWNSVFAKKYGNPESVLGLIANGMFNLNRYAKHDSCQTSNRQDIYELKNRFIKKLYLGGLCTGLSLSAIELSEKICYSCDGTGYNDFEDKCLDCNGTGIYLPAKKLEFIVFEFLIEGQKYTWHQPKELIDFEVDLSEVKKADMNDTQIKPIEIEYKELTKAKALIRWYLDCNHTS